MNNTSILNQVREQLQGIVIHVGKSEQANSGAYPFYKQGSQATAFDFVGDMLFGDGIGDDEPVGFVV